MADIKTVVRFNDESKEIEVVLVAGDVEEKIGSVEADIYNQWLPAPVDNTEEIATLTAERDEWKNKYEVLKEVLPVTPVTPPAVEPVVQEVTPPAPPVETPAPPVAE